MNKIAKDFKDKGVVFYVLYTREPHAGEKRGPMDFSGIKQTKTAKERVDYALEMIKEYKDEKRPILIDTFGPKCLQATLGGGMPNSLAIIDGKGKLVFWETWAKAPALRKKLEEMTAKKQSAPRENLGK